MATPVSMPRQGISVESCVLTEWRKEVGDRVEKGDVLFTYENDKATSEEVSEVEGILLGKFFAEGDDIPVLTNVCVVGQEGEDITGFLPDKLNGSAITEIKHYKGEQKINDGEDVEILNISPRARKLAEKYNLDYRYAKPTGPRGSIVEKDIQNMLYKEPEYEDISLSKIRKVIADSMHKSLVSSPQLTLNTSFDASGILNLRKQLKENREELEPGDITINDMILFAVSRTLLKHQMLNAHFLDDRIRVFKNVHLGVAVDCDRGLMVPTIFDANLKTLNEISSEVKTRIEECKTGSIKEDYLKDATFTVSNLGKLDIESFTPILNPPQTGILGLNTIIQRPREYAGEIRYYPAMRLSLTFDHRALDGAPAARFLKDLKKNLHGFFGLVIREYEN